MKAGAKRRRTKEEIRQAKLEEQERLREIDAKIERIQEMDRQVAQANQV